MGIFSVVEAQEGGVREPSSPQESRSDFSAEIDKQIQTIRQTYQLQVVYKEPPALRDARFHFTLANPGNYDLVNRYLVLLQEELAKYPAPFLAQMPSRKIYVVEKVFWGEQGVEGFCVSHKDMIIFDFLRSSRNALQQRHNIHHEMFHVVDLQASHSLRNDLTGKWQELTKNFPYIYERSQRRLSQNSQLFTPPYPGFVTEYAMSSMDEDQAEVFGCLFIGSQSKILHRWINDDEILRAKVDFIKKFLYDFCKDLNEDYWDSNFQIKNKGETH